MIKRLKFDKKNPSEVISYLAKLDAFSSDVPPSVYEIINDVKKRGDAALFEYAEKFDKAKLKSLKVSPVDIKKAYSFIDKKVLPAIKKAAKNIKDFHELQIKNIKGYIYRNTGYTIKQKYIPVDSVGLHIPGGQAPLFSTVLMAGIPAIAAGVKKIVLVSPPRYNSEINPYVLVAADIIGIKEIYRCGGAQSIAALSFGTQSVPKVNKVVGPGNIYSTAAKKHLFGTIGIDSINGPSEVTVIADDTANPEFVLYDLLAQAEHINGHSVLITTSVKLADFIEARLKLKETDMNINTAIVVVSSIADAIDIANEKGPEHLTVCTKNSSKVIERITNAPAIFEGNYSPVAFGDYMAGANHILPTNGTSKFFSGLSVLDFLKHTHIVKASAAAFKAFGKEAELMASTETLDFHAKSMEARRIKGK